MFGQEFIIAGFIGPQEILMIIIKVGVPIALIIALLRWLGAWMFHINDVIGYQKEMISILKKMNNTQDKILKSLKEEIKE